MLTLVTWVVKTTLSSVKFFTFLAEHVMIFVGDLDINIKQYVNRKITPSC